MNLLDLREEVDEGEASNRGGRWANRNPKAKAKAGGRNRRQRNRPGEDGKRQSGFRAMNSQTSNLSDYSDYSDVGEEEAAKEASQPQARDEEETTKRDSKPPGPVAKPVALELESGPPQPGAELLKDDAEAQRVSVAPLEVGSNETSGGSEGFRDARVIAERRQLLQYSPPEIAVNQQGPHFKQNVWEFYMVKGAWSDSMTVALNHASMIAPCVVPCIWPVRVFQTLKRAAPVSCKCCPCCNCPVGGCCALPVIGFIFLLPIVCALTFVPQIAAILVEQAKQLPEPIGNRDDLEQLVAIFSAVATGVSILFFIWAWSRILLGVGVKYQIQEAIEKPNATVCKAMCCLCCFNMRVAVHVDRAQGFIKVKKEDTTLIDLSDQMATLPPPSQYEMV